jgi:hypothetical protein
MRMQTKYGNKRTEVSGYSFSSRLEADLFLFLKQLEHCGEYQNVRCQVNVSLTDAEIKMIPDFAAVHKATGEVHYFEAKGFVTAVYAIKRRLWKAGYGPGTLFVYVRSGKAGLKLLETLIPKKHPTHD